MSFDPAAINPGVRRLVALLRAWGYETTDSGDGVTNVEAGLEGARPYPHVTMRVPPAALSQAADRLRDLLQIRGVHVREFGPQLDAPAIQATYDPANQVALVELVGVDDSTIDLPPTVPRRTS